jgi:peroxiredoxin Q/BCP
MPLAIGDAAPPFSLPSTSGGEVSLASLRGQRFVLYFYPKDDTPGCTTEACDFRDNLARVKAAGAEVYGVSKDSLAAHEKFRGKYGLPFPLLSDAGNEVAKAYGAFGEKKMYGKPVTGTIRSTFLIDAKGKIEQVWSPVKVKGHVEKVLAALAGEQAEAGAEVSTQAKAPAKAKKKA